MIVTQEMLSSSLAYKIIRKHRHPEGWVTVQFADKDLDIPVQQLIVHLFAWDVLKAFKVPIESRHLYHPLGHCSNSTVMGKLFTSIMLELVPKLKTKRDKDKFNEEIWQAVNKMDDFGCNELNEFHCGLSLIGLAKVVEHPVIKKILDVDIKEEYGIANIERILADATVKLTSALGDRNVMSMEENILYPYQASKLLNPNQLSQVLIAYGPRSELNDKVMAKPIRGSSLFGITTAYEFAAEAQNARKNAYYSKDAIPKSQYSGRKLGILCSSLSNMYSGDCKTKHTLPVVVTTTIKNFLLGRYIVEDGKLVMLLQNNIDEYLGKEINLRSPFTCKHTDGCCETCYGLLSISVPEGANIGMLASSKTVAQISQFILSVKHFGTTKSRMYVIPDKALNFIERHATGLHFKKSVVDSRKIVSLGIDTTFIRGSLYDLLQMEDELAIPEERYSEVPELLIKYDDGNIETLDLVIGDSSPYLSKEFLFYTRDKYNDISSQGNISWIPMPTDNSFPVMKTAIISDSMMSYVSAITKFLENGVLARYKDVPQALNDFCELLYTRAKVALADVELILKAHMVSSENNYSIPVLTNPKNARFKPTVDIIQNRTVSGELALQGHKKYLADPYTFSVPKEASPFDSFFDILKYNLA